MGESCGKEACVKGFLEVSDELATKPWGRTAVLGKSAGNEPFDPQANFGALWVCCREVFVLS